MAPACCCLGGSHFRRWFVVLARTAVSPGDSFGLAAESVSAAHRTQRDVHQQVRGRERLSSPRHSGRARLRAVGCRHPSYVTAPILCREYSVGPCLGAGPCLSRRAAWYGGQPRRHQRRAAHTTPRRRADRYIGRRLGNALLLEPTSIANEAACSCWKGRDDQPSNYLGRDKHIKGLKTRSSQRRNARLECSKRPPWLMS